MADPKDATSSIPFRIAIPARYGASRLPGKPLRLLAGKTLIAHVHARAMACGAQEVVIATDDDRIRTVAEDFGATVCMTASTHNSGTERIAEVATQRGWADNDIVVNLQGDEPGTPPAIIQQVAEALAAHPEAGIATLCTPITEAKDLCSPHIVKVVRDARQYALAFSRAPIPWHREAFQGPSDSWTLPTTVMWYRHIGLYAYRVGTLRRYIQLPVTAIEQAESLEQWRALWHGIPIIVPEAVAIPLPGIDTAEDVVRLESTLNGAL